MECRRRGNHDGRHRQHARQHARKHIDTHGRDVALGHGAGRGLLTLFYFFGRLPKNK
jgi:hypothetical protein